MPSASTILRLPLAAAVMLFAHLVCGCDPAEEHSKSHPSSKPAAAATQPTTRPSTLPSTTRPTTSPATAPSATQPAVADAASTKPASAPPAAAAEDPRTVQSIQQLRSIVVAAQLYASKNKNQLPPDLKTLVDAKMLQASNLKSPFGPLPDSADDVWSRPNVHGAMPADTVFGYDRSSYIHGNKVVVMYADGHVSAIPQTEFENALKQPSNQGVDYKLPARK
jgi:prepilin-type processing-associated H-X9-DG protein